MAKFEGVLETFAPFFDSVELIEADGDPCLGWNSWDATFNTLSLEDTPKSKDTFAFKSMVGPCHPLFLACFSKAITVRSTIKALFLWGSASGQTSKSDTLKSNARLICRDLHNSKKKMILWIPYSKLLSNKWHSTLWYRVQANLHKISPERRINSKSSFGLKLIWRTLLILILKMVTKPTL